MIENVFDSIFGFRRLTALMNEVLARQTKILTKLELLEVGIMANFQDVINGIQTNTLAVNDVLNTAQTTSSTVQSILQKALDGDVDDSEIEHALELLNQQNTQILGAKTAIIASLPTIPTPDKPVTPDTPLPSPVPSPSTPDNIVINPLTDSPIPGLFKLDIK